MSDVLDWEKPDFAVLLGDLIQGEGTQLANATHNVDRYAAPLVERDVAFGSALGNHDSTYNLSSRDSILREKRFPQSYTEQMVFGDDVGVTNYYLPVYSNNCTDEAKCSPETLLWFFDSRGGMRYQQRNSTGSDIGRIDAVHPDVVEWFKKTHHELIHKYKKLVPSVAFVHSPTNATRAIQEQMDLSQTRHPGLQEDDQPLPMGTACSDGTYECEYNEADQPFLEAIVSTPGLLAMFHAHNHGTTWCYKWDSLVPGMDIKGNGINLCTGQHTGYGGYGHWTRGARQLLLSQDMLKHWEAETWIRLETEEVVGRISLNATYGMDEYEETPVTFTSEPATFELDV